MSKNLWAIGITSDISIGLYQSENKDDGCWWIYEGKKLKYFDYFSEERIVENLKILLIVFVIGRYFVSIVRFKNK